MVLVVMGGVLDAWMVTQSAPDGLRVRTQFPRFQDMYTVILQNNKPDAAYTSGEVVPPYHGCCCWFLW